MSVQVNAFLWGYLHKEAAGVGTIATQAVNAGTTMMEKSLALTLAAPVLLGLAGGYTWSRVTSPPSDSGTIQKQMVAHELEEALALIKRRQAMQKASEKAKAPVNSRSLRLL